MIYRTSCRITVSAMCAGQWSNSHGRVHRSHTVKTNASMKFRFMTPQGWPAAQNLPRSGRGILLFDWFLPDISGAGYH